MTLFNKNASHGRGDTQVHIISHLPDFRLPKLAPL